MPKKGENIYKRKDGRWEGRYIKYYDVDGKAKYGYIYGATYYETRNKLREKRAAPCSEIFEQSKITKYSDILIRWLESTRINVKESTYARYRQLVERHITPDLGNYQINKISTHVIEKFVEEKFKNGRLDGKGSLSPKTVTDIIAVVKSSVAYAAYHGFNISCNLSKLTVKKKDKEMTVLTIQEQKKLTSLLVDSTDVDKVGILIRLYTGIRIGELCALKWENINLSNKTLKINETMQRIQNMNPNENTKTKIVITEPKSSGSIRDIPIPVFLIPVIKEFQDKPDTYLLTGKRNKYIEPRTMQNCFKRFIKESGLRSVNYHALRHTFATRCVEVGFELKSLSEILGHSNVNITLNRYVHSSFELKSINMNKLSLIP